MTIEISLTTVFNVARNVFALGGLVTFIFLARAFIGGYIRAHRKSKAKAKKKPNAARIQTHPARGKK
jgi:hypothetical protein